LRSKQTRGANESHEKSQTSREAIGKTLATEEASGGEASAAKKRQTEKTRGVGWGQFAVRKFSEGRPGSGAGEGRYEEREDAFFEDGHEEGRKRG